MPSKTTSKTSSTTTAKKGTTSQKKKRSTHRRFSSRTKATAVLSLWSERRSTAEICRELDITYTMLQNWQEAALDAMLERLEPRVKAEEDQPPALKPKLARLLAKKTRVKEVTPTQSGTLSPSEDGTTPLSEKLEKRLTAAQGKST